MNVHQDLVQWGRGGIHDRLVGLDPVQTPFFPASPSGLNATYLESELRGRERKRWMGTCRPAAASSRLLTHGYQARLSASKPTVKEKRRNPSRV